MNFVTKIFGRPTTRTKKETVEGSGIFIDTIKYGHVGYLGQLYYKLYHGLIKLAYLVYTPSFDFRYKRFGVCDIELDGINTKDYPDFCDAYVHSACWNDTLEYLTDNELDMLTNAMEYDELYELIINRIY